MPVLPLSFHYCGVYFQSLCKKPRLKKGIVRRAHATGRKDNLHGSQESLISSIDETESTTSTVNTEISAESNLASTDTSGISSEGDSSKSSEKGSDARLSEKVDNLERTKKETEEVESKPNKEQQADTEMDQSLTEAVKKSDMSTNEILAVMEQKQRDSHKSNLSKAKILVIILVLTNIPAAMYFSLIHQRGTISVMKYIYDASQEKNVDVLFLMPCHSTPYYRYVGATNMQHL